ncbi:MAG: GIY-YIG nuclease family protein, partial [Bacteroidota bacterium]
METETFTVYILFSDKLNRFYTGFTSDLNIRLQFHKISENHKFTHNA